MKASLSYLFLTTSILMVTACSQPELPQQSMPTPQVDVANPIQATITEGDEYSGRFEAVS